MGKGRLEAFSDGVIAIIITIMVLEMKVPHGDTIASLKPLIPVFISYVRSFVYVAIYWNNHHHMMHAAQHVNGRVLWANVHLLFWLSIIPFVTGWMGENHFSTWPVALYGMALFMTGTAYTILAMELKRLHGPKSDIAIAIGRDKKGKLSLVIYTIGIALTFWNSWLGFSLYVIVAATWFIPDKRIENMMVEKKSTEIENKN
ncbi:MAG: TMEM175 family protein [Bacteroidota bacterium]